MKIYSKLVSPSNFLDYKSYLLSLYSHIRADLEDNYSYEKFAEDLGFSKTNILHQIIRGHRNLTNKTAEKIIKALEIKKYEKKYLLALIEYNNSNDLKFRDDKFDELMELKRETTPEEIDKFWLEYVSEWYHPVIREMILMKNFKNDPKWIANQITPSIKPEQVKKSIDLLLKLELIEINTTDGSLKQTEKLMNTGHRVKNMAIAYYHHQMINLAKESLVRAKGDERDISGMTLCIEEASIEKLKSMIHDFKEKVIVESENSNQGDKVVQFNIQLFPFTK